MVAPPPPLYDDTIISYYILRYMCLMLHFAVGGVYLDGLKRDERRVQSPFPGLVSSQMGIPTDG